VSEEHEHRRKSGAGLVARAHSPHRLEALTDGVFAIAMTILVLELHVPEGDTAKEVIQAAREQWPIFGAYVVSFILLGVYWYGQRSQYDFIRRVDRQLTWLNIFFLLGVCTLPFAAAMLGTYRKMPQAVHFYGAVLIFCSVLHAWIWWYATSARRNLVDPKETTPDVVAVGKRLAIVPVFFYVLAMGVSFVDFRLSLLMFALVPVLYVFDVVRHLRLPGAPDAEAGEDVPE
jgi:uncharacterized membrane protein